MKAKKIIINRFIINFYKGGGGCSRFWNVRAPAFIRVPRFSFGMMRLIVMNNMDLFKMFFVKNRLLFYILSNAILESN